MSPRPLVCPSTRPRLGVPSLPEFLCVGGHKEGGWGRAGPDGALSVGSGGGGAWRSSFTKTALSPQAAGLSFCPARGLPSTTSEAPQAGPPAFAPQPGASPGQGRPRTDRSYQSSAQRGSQEGDQGAASRPVEAGCGCWAGVLSGEALAGWIRPHSRQGSWRRGSVTAWGRGEPRASRPGAALSWPARPRDLACLLWPSRLCGLSPATLRLRPGLGCSRLTLPEPSGPPSC